MQDFTGLYRTTVLDKIPPTMWKFARNILLSKGYTSVANEDGFDFKHKVPGELIGKIDTNESIVYFSVDETFSYIGYYNTNEPDGDYNLVLRTSLLNFNRFRPIEGVYFYNYLGELIVGFCDGVYEDSNTPKLINITKIGIELDSYFDLVNPIEIKKLEMFPTGLTPKSVIGYNNLGSLAADVVYITYAYVLPDGETSTFFFPVTDVAYPAFNFKETKRRSVDLTIRNLDTTYEYFKLGFVVVLDNGITAYETEPLLITSFQYDYTLGSLSGLKSISPDEIVIPKSVFSRVETMTVCQNEIELGKLVQDNKIDFQKYANNIKLGLNYEIRKPEHHTAPTLCPDEVYAFYISLELENGVFSDEFHIPGNLPRFGDERDVLTQAELNALGLGDLDASKGIKRFQIRNTGDYKITTPPTNVDNYFDLELLWGFWENRETYPNVVDYDSTEDYQGNPITTGVGDLRGQNIRYHRMPGLDTLVTKFPCILGYDVKNQADLTMGLVPAFNVTILNFADVVPLEVREKIKSYRISIVKRKANNRLVEDISFLKQDFYTDKDMITRSMQKGRYAGYNYPNDEAERQSYQSFGVARLRSNTLMTYKPNINPSIIKANYGVSSNINKSTTKVEGLDEIDITDPSKFGTLGYGSGLTRGIYFLIPNAQRYALVKSVKYYPGNVASEDLDYNESIVEVISNNTNQTNPISTYVTNWNPIQYPNYPNEKNVVLKGWNKATLSYENFSYLNVDADLFQSELSVTLLNIINNLYQGFNPKEFIVLGDIVKTANGVFTDSHSLTPYPSVRNCGDIFTNNSYSIPQMTYRNVNTPVTVTALLFNQLYIRGNIAVTANNVVYINKDRKYGRYYNSIEDFEELENFTYEVTVFNNEGMRSLNDLVTAVAFNPKNNYIGYFPYRIARSLTLSSESISTNNVRSFLSNNYKDMPSDRGEIVALRGTSKILYIQQKYSLFIARIKDTIGTGEDTAYLGQGDIFDREPDEVGYGSNKGNIGSTSKFACIVFEGGYLVVNEVKGKVHLVTNQPKEISLQGLQHELEETWDTFLPAYNIDRLGKKTNIDNPYTEIGHLAGFDEKYNRLFITKKMYELLPQYQSLATVEKGKYRILVDNGFQFVFTIVDIGDLRYFREVSKTFSYSLYGEGGWICEHDYFPTSYSFNSNGTFVTSLNDVYKMNSRKNKGTFFGEKFRSYIDCVFNGRTDLSKLYQNVSWLTEVVGENNERFYFKTVDAIALYNNFQCSGEIEILDNTLSISRNVENIWNFNSFRSMTIDKDSPVINEEGEILINNINNSKSWFDKSNFISTFIVVRMIMNNKENHTVYINSINVKSRTSDR